ncbi:hypothetical protein BDA99DRAFT_535173 [Phascolomyces articulosus]|uniref:Uncharacterized protein n=1 Tax=Phascolomyces articulosus TaxID=60185 RepID=A0AAD5K4Q7_9FUNG|nr:hypothetical protein BDA99DRAFT_535173 [Phascolomyces articulosus]
MTTITCHIHLMFISVLDTGMLEHDDNQLLTRIRTRIEAIDGYYYYQEFAPNPWLKSGCIFSCHCSQDQDAQNQVADSRHRRLDSRLKWENYSPDSQLFEKHENPSNADFVKKHINFVKQNTPPDKSYEKF